MTQSQPATPATRHPHHFEDLSPDDFERLVYWLVRRCGEFDAVQWYGGARDKGRDVVAYKHTAAGREQWTIQCKRYQCIAFPTLRDELDKLAQHARKEADFAPDVIVFATACAVPPAVKDRAAAHARELGLPEPYYWGRLELDEMLKQQPETEEQFFSRRPIPTGVQDTWGGEAAPEGAQIAIWVAVIGAVATIVAAAIGILPDVVPEATPTPTVMPTQTATVTAPPPSPTVPTPTVATPTVPGPTPTPPLAVIEIVHVEYDPEGSDLEGEYVLLRNTTEVDQDLTAWTIEDEDGHVFRFPSFVLGPRATVKVWTRAGENTEEDLYWRYGRGLWDNDGDTATLEDYRGELVVTFTYPR